MRHSFFKYVRIIDRYLSSNDAVTRNMEKPRTISEYIRWLRKSLGVSVDKYYYAYYDLATSKARDGLEASNFWARLVGNLREYDQEYQLKTGYPLFTGIEPKLLVKPFDSFLLKTYRKNVLENRTWPAEPEDGWILPNNWLSRINDIIRTLFVVKYFDGVRFMIEKIDSLCEQQKMEFSASFEAREEGYYAAHLTTKQLLEVPKINWDTEKIWFSVELQVTTQLQEVIRKLLHKYYERKRGMIEEATEKWQWDYSCDEFGANYIGHILHYIEGMIVEIRERQKGTIE
jgi:hypothetical protein